MSDVIHACAVSGPHLRHKFMFGRQVFQCPGVGEQDEGYLISHYRTKSEVESAKLDRITRIVEAEEREAAIAGRVPSVPTVFLRNALRDEA